MILLDGPYYYAYDSTMNSEMLIIIDKSGERKVKNGITCSLTYESSRVLSGHGLVAQGLAACLRIQGIGAERVESIQACRDV